MGEFDLIERFFKTPATAHPGSGVALGIGDDCALLRPSAGNKCCHSAWCTRFSPRRRPQVKTITASCSGSTMQYWPNTPDA